MQLLGGDRSLIQSFNNKFDMLEDWTAAAVAVFLILQAIVMIANVVVRQLGSDIVMANSTAQALIAWMTFSVAAQQAREDEHFNIDILHSRLPDRIRQLNEVFLKSVAFIFAVTFLLSGIMIVTDTAGEFSASGFPTFLLYLPAVLGGLILTIEYLRQLVRRVVKIRG